MPRAKLPLLNRSYCKISAFILGYYTANNFSSSRINRDWECMQSVLFMTELIIPRNNVAAAATTAQYIASASKSVFLSPFSDSCNEFRDHLQDKNFIMK